MRSLTEALCTGSGVVLRRGAFEDGFRRGWNGERVPAEALREVAAVRARHGFVERPAPLLTPPDGNSKLAKSPDGFSHWGLTLAQHVVHLSDGRRLRSCPWSGQCAAVCVLRNGHGARPSVVRAREWRSELAATRPLSFLWLVGFELGAAAVADPIGSAGVAFRPNVASDVDWAQVLGENWARGIGVVAYGYTKRPAVLWGGDGCVGGMHEAYSWHEASPVEGVRAFLALGGAVSLVTSRRPGDPVDADAVRRWLGVGEGVRVVDADAVDTWMVASGAVVGDLSAKGAARRLIGRPGRSFVADVYGVGSDAVGSGVAVDVKGVGR